MQIAVMPKCWMEDICNGKMSLYEWIDISAQLECDGLEMYSRFPELHQPGGLQRIAAQASALGMTLPMMCHSPDFTLADPDARQREINNQITMIRITAELGGQFCRTLSGQGQPGLSVADGIDRVVACIEACLPEAERCGVHLVIENHYKDSFWRYPEFAQKRDVFLALIARIDSPWFGVQYDPSNALVAGNDPVALLDVVLPRVKTMHASDRYLLPGVTLEDLRASDGSIGYLDKLCHGVTGRGANDYHAIFTRLAGANFAGWVSIEDGMNGMEEMKESIDFLKRMRAQYFGTPV